MLRLLVLLLALACVAGAAEPNRGWTKHWAVSIGALAGANAADIQASRGGYEANPLLRGPNGRFASGRAIAVKSGIIGGVVLVQWLLSRRHPERRKAFAVTNYALAGVVTGVAIRNSRISR